ncbi:hypothetical protein [Candidatus Pelagibacter sp. HIMB1593]|uniref:hypothetical protein n=1 Tax=Candidatus Pelagibacter sp. HIMB1593 TaxID=3413355 RepID=UPI003F871D21
MNLKINRYYFFTFCVYSLGSISFYFDNSLRYNFGFLFYFWFFLIFRENLNSKLNGQDLIFLIYKIILLLIPSFAIYYYHRQDFTHILFVIILCFDILEYLFDRPKTLNNVSKNKYLDKKDLIIYFSLSSWTVIGPFFFGQGNHLIGMSSFMFPFSISLIYLEKILKTLKNPIFGGIFLIYHFSFSAVYLYFHWVGMGRVFLAVLFLSPILIYFHYCRIFISHFIFYIACPIALMILQSSRYKNFSFEEYLIGSAGYHLQITEMVQSTKYFAQTQWNAFFDQYLLMYFIHVPREIWSSKPIPIGFWAVDVIFEESVRTNPTIGVDKEFSISLGFVGEQMLMFGEKFYIGLIFTLITIVVIRKLVSYLSFNSIVPLLIFDLNLVSYFWGGMSIFGSRLWVLLIPCLILLITQHSFSLLNEKSKSNI